ncbi:MAG TPA: hypothetical protein VND64_33765 [Pirellulales bacterium]|nr:hypothetical protein [Pirellulales bacterium]
MNPYRKPMPHETVTLVDTDGNVWARLNCRDCLLKDPNELRFPVWVLRGTGSGLCQRCRKPREESQEEPRGSQGFNSNLRRSDIHREQYDGERRWYQEEVSGDW